MAPANPGTSVHFLSLVSPFRHLQCYVVSEIKCLIRVKMNHHALREERAEVMAQEEEYQIISNSNSYWFTFVLNPSILSTSSTEIICSKEMQSITYSNLKSLAFSLTLVLFNPKLYFSGSMSFVTYFKFCLQVLLFSK